MKVLGIETSCDETAVCLIEASGNFGPDFSFRVLGNALYSQVATHAPWGGVYPNLAKREHAKNLVPLLESVLDQAGGLLPASGKIMIYHNFKETLLREPELFAQLEQFLERYQTPRVDAIAVTAGPGLEPALWVGVNFAKALSAAWHVPIVAVNHLEGHIVMGAAEDGKLKTFEFPALALLISGGHTEIDFLPAWPRFETVGQTRDDAVGEAFDKVARMMELPYPGGPEISRLAEIARTRKVEPYGFRLPRPMLHEPNFDFSFSGLKTAVRRLIGDHKLSDEEKSMIALEFENAAADVLVAKTKRAAEAYGAKTILVGGGVSANNFIKQRLTRSLNIPVLASPAELATDNALMIALAGYFRALKNEFIEHSALRANGNLKLGSSALASI